MFTNVEQTVVTMTAPASPPTWSTWKQAASVLAHAANLRRTLSISIAVGTVFFVMNQLPAVLAGQMTVAVAVKAALTYLVPFCTSNYGILAASRRPSISQEVPQPKSTANQEVYA
jgi:hypothetical protein